MSVNGHDGDELPQRFNGGLAAFLISDIKMPRQCAPSAYNTETKTPLDHSLVADLIDKQHNRKPSVDASVESVDAVLKAQTEMLRVMAEKGYPAEQIKAVISALGEKSTDEKQPSTDGRQTEEDLNTLRRRRERDKKYQTERRRKAKGASSSSVDAPKCAPISISSTLPFLEVDNDKKESKSSGIRARAKLPAHRIPDDWQATEADLATARKYLPADRIPIEATKFKNYWLGRGDRKAVSTNWSLNWENWCVNALEYSGGRNVRSGSGVSNQAPRKENGAERSLRLAREASANKSGVGLSGSGERVVDLDSSEWTTGSLPGTNGRGTGDL